MKLSFCVFQDEIGHWYNYIKAVQEKMKHVDESFNVNYAETDIHTYTNEHKLHRTQAELATNLLDFLDEKYYWKKWLVISHKKTFRGVCM